MNLATVARAMCIAALWIGAGKCSVAAPAKAITGKQALERHCARCHSIDKIGVSPLEGALPLRDIYRRYSLERLQFELSEGVGSRHPDMPQIQFSAEQIDAILVYLGGLSDQPH